jgi:hypothetical protein
METVRRISVQPEFNLLVDTVRYISFLTDVNYLNLCTRLRKCALCNIKRVQKHRLRPDVPLPSEYTEQGV